jgi:hypothetical protein
MILNNPEKEEKEENTWDISYLKLEIIKKINEWHA